MIFRLAISAATYRGANCPTLKTAEKGAEWVTVKQPKNSRKNSRNTRKTAEKHSKQLFFGCFGCFSGCFSAVLPWPTRHPFRLFFGCLQCRAFGTSVGGRGDCNFRPKSVKNYLNNSQNHFWSATWTSVILHFQILQTLCKPEIT